MFESNNPHTSALLSVVLLILVSGINLSCSGWEAFVGKTYRTFSDYRLWQAGLSSHGIIPDKTRALRRPSSLSSRISPRPATRTSRTKSSRLTMVRRKRRRDFAASLGNNMKQALSSISR